MYHLDWISYTIECSRPEDDLRCRQGVNPPLKVKLYHPTLGKSSCHGRASGKSFTSSKIRPDPSKLQTGYGPGLRFQAISLSKAWAAIPGGGGGGGTRPPPHLEFVWGIVPLDFWYLIIFVCLFCISLFWMFMSIALIGSCCVKWMFQPHADDVINQIII